VDGSSHMRDASDESIDASVDARDARVDARDARVDARDARVDARDATTPHVCDTNAAFTALTSLSAIDDLFYSVQSAFLDGSTLYFSARQIATGDYDLFATTGDPETDSFPPASRLANVNGTYDDGAPVLSFDGLTLYFNSSSNGSDLDIYYAKR